MNDKSHQLRLLGWFGSALVLIFSMISIRYVIAYGWPEDVLTWLYIPMAVIALWSALTFVPVAVLCAFTAVHGARKVIVNIAWLMATAAIGLVVLDSELFAANQFHLTALTARILGAPSWVFLGIVTLIAGVFLRHLLTRIDRALKDDTGGGKGKWVAAAIVGAILVSQSIHIWADATYRVSIPRFTHYLPLYQPATAVERLVDWGLVDLDAARRQQLNAKLDAGSSVNYPLAPLHCSKESSLNILLVVIDAQRGDLIDPRITPKLDRLASSSSVFEKHHSGGNSSKMGLFSLFYSLPGTYFESFAAEQRSPVLIDQLQRQGYAISILSSAELYRPVELDRTAFANLDNIRLETPSANGLAWEKDRVITDDWFAFLDRKQADQPFFGFLFYGSANRRVFPPDLEAPNVAGDQRWQHYVNAIHYNDQLLGEVLDDLGRRNLIDNTVVIVTSDHGEEFSQSGSGFTGHGSAYTSDQLATPMVVRWPGVDPKRYSHRTSHHDVAPTLLKRALNCSSDASNFSVGKDLYFEKDWDWLIAASYSDFAIVEPSQVTISRRGGLFELRDANYQVDTELKLNPHVVTDALAAMQRFYVQP